MKHRPVHKHSRRAFTLLEVSLAATIGALIIASVIALLITLRKQDRWNAARTTTTVQTATAHRAIANALRTLVMHEGDPPGRDSLEQGQSRRQQNEEQPDTANPNRRNETGDDENADGSLTTVRAPSRLVLEADNNAGPLMQMVRDGLVMTYPPQRLEVTLTAPPVYPPPTIGGSLVSLTRHMGQDSARAQQLTPTRQTVADQRMLTRQLERLQRQREDSATRHQDDVSEDHETPQVFAPGLRGVFELRYRPANANAPSLDDGGVWSLWWRVLEGQGLDAELDAADASSVRAQERTVRRLAEGDPNAFDSLTQAYDNPGMLLLDNIRSCYWEVFDDGGFHPTIDAAYVTELPAYITFEYETVTGRWSSWLFEIAWSVGPEPGTPTDVQFDETTATRRLAGDDALELPGDLSQQRRRPGSALPATTPIRPPPATQPRRTPRDSDS